MCPGGFLSARRGVRPPEVCGLASRIGPSHVWRMQSIVSQGGPSTSQSGPAQPGPTAGPSPKMRTEGTEGSDRNHRMVWVSPPRATDTTPPAQAAQSPPSLVLDGAPAASWGTLGLTSLRATNFFLISDLNLPSFSLKPSLTPPAHKTALIKLQQSHSLCL